MSDTEKTGPVDVVEAQVVGVDQAELWRKSMKAIGESIEANKADVAQERAAQRHETKETLYFRAEPARGGLWKVVCISGMSAHVRSLEAIADTPENAMFDARFHYAQALYRAKLTKNWEAARARAARAELVMADVVR